MESPTTPRPRLLVVDDEAEVRDLLETWFGSAGYDVQTASEGLEAIAWMRRAAFDVVVTDLRMPGLTGLQLLAILKDLAPEVEVIFLTGEGTMKDAIEALREGQAFDFLTKPVTNLRQLTVVVERALARRDAREAARARPSASTNRPPGDAPLTDRDLELLHLLAEGLDNRAIGDKLFLSEKTVKNNLSRLYEKIQVKSRTQAIAYGHEHGLA